jgi:hypothetical protein
MRDGEMAFILRQAADSEKIMAAERRRKFWLILSCALFFAALLFLVALQYGAAAAQSALPEAQAIMVRHGLTPQIQKYGAMMTVMFGCSPGSKTVLREALAEALRTDFGERYERTVFVMPTAVAELYVNRDAGSWTIVRTGPYKQACIALAGVRRFGPEQVPI